MSGGRLVVLDRQGRDGKQFPLPSGLATLGSDAACDIMVLLPSIRPHHATVVVHANQSIVRNVSDGETLVNGQPVSVAALAHGDVVSLGGRSLRWLYDRPGAVRPLHVQPDLALVTGGGRPKGRRRGSAAASAALKDRSLQLELEMRHRASMPANAGGKQVAVVQPQRRDTNERIESNSRSVTGSPRSTPNHRSRISRNDSPQTNTSVEIEATGRKSTPRVSPKSAALQNTTKASLWIESRRAASAKKRTPLRLAVLRKAHSARKPAVAKIQAPAKIDLTKQAAIMLMTGHTPRAKLSSSPQSGGKRSPSLVLKKPVPAARPSVDRSAPSPKRTPKRTPKRGMTSVTPNVSRRSSRRATTAQQSLPILEITDTESQNSSSRLSRSSTLPKTSPLGSPLLQRPQKSSLKDPSVKSIRKTESIKFDLSNLEIHPEDDVSEILLVTDTTVNKTTTDDSSEDEVTLRYSDTSAPNSPSSRTSIHSRTSRILEKVGSPVLRESRVSKRKTLTPELPQTRKSLRGSFIVQKALEINSANDINNSSRYSCRTTKTVSDQSYDTTVESAFKTRTLSPRSLGQNDMESYSIVDLLSVDSNESTKSASVYGSVGSTRSSSIVFGTPQMSAGRKTRSTIEPNFLGSSTPYVGRARASLRSQSSSGVSTRKSSPDKATRSSVSRRSKSLSTPENSAKHISINSTKISRASKNRSRINDSDPQFVSLATTASETEESPKSSRHSSRATQSHNSMNVTIKSPGNSTFLSKSSPRTSIRSKLSPRNSPRTSQTYVSSKNKRGSFHKNITINTTLANSSQDEGAVTPENRNSPEGVGTPMLSMKSLLDSSQGSLASSSSPKKTRTSAKRKTIGAVLPQNKKARSSLRSKSFNVAALKSLRSTRLSNESPKVSKTNEIFSQTDDEIVTPKSAVKLIQEAVKNQHSTAKKPQSKRSIIDTLNESDIVKQLFNSPVKRKLSQSMSEFSRKQLFDNDDVAMRRPKRNTVALTGRTPNNFGLDETQQITPEKFVSPLSTPSNSPNLSGVKLLFRLNTPNDDLRNVKGVKKILRTPRIRKSAKNDLTNIGGVKQIFARSPRNRLSDVRVKEVFATSPKNDLRRVSGVKSLFQSQKKIKPPKNDLSDVRGVRNLFTRKSVANDLRNVSGVKTTLKANSPKNDLTDVRDVRRIFRQEKQRNDYSDLSGVEELFNESTASRRDAESLFDQLIGKPTIKAVYSKSFISNNKSKPSRGKRTKSLHHSIDLITNNVEQWLEEELNNRIHKDDTIKSKVTKELQKLAIDTTEWNEPLRTTRVRDSTLQRSRIEASVGKSASQLYSAHTLPIKKRSLMGEVLLEKGAPLDNSNKLPIKKRAVVHSTPVKGRYNMTMNASELGRVSPITAVDKTQILETNKHQQLKESPKSKMHRAIEVNKDEPGLEVEILNEFLKSPTKATRARKQAGEIQQLATQKRKVTKEKEVDEALRAAEVKFTRGTRARLNTNNAKNLSKTSLSPKVTGRRRLNISNIVSKTQKESSQEAPSHGTRRNNAESSVTARQSRTTRKRKIDQPTAENCPTETVSKPKRARNTEKQLPSVEKKSPKPKAKQAKSQENKPTPKKMRGAKATVESPVKRVRGLRSKSQVTTVINTKKRRSSLVINKKPPVMSSRNTRNGKEKISSPAQSSKRALSTRRQKAEVEPKSVKKTGAKLVVAKASPSMKPQAKRPQRIQGQIKESPQKSQPEVTKRGRRNAVELEQNTSPVQRRAKSKGRSKVEQETKPDSPKKRGRRAANKSLISEESTNKRSLKSAVKPESKEKTIKKSTNISVEVQPKRARSTRRNVTQPAETATKSQGKKLASQESIQFEPVKRSLRTKEEETNVVTETRRRRKRKNEDEQQAVPAKVAKSNTKATKGRTAAVSDVQSVTGRQTRTTKDNKAETLKSKKQDVSETVQKNNTRGQKTTKTAKETVQSKPQATKPAKGKAAAAAPPARVGSRKKVASPAKRKEITSPVKGLAVSSRSRRR